MKTPICCDVQTVFSLHSCGLRHDSHHSCLPRKLSAVAALGGISVGMKIEWHAHYANFVGGSATPLEGTQRQVRAHETQTVECQKAVIDGDWQGKGHQLCPL